MISYVSLVWHCRFIADLRHCCYRIDTQDVILGQKMAKRVVEVGATETLTGMAKRTLKAKYETFDAANSIRRKFLSSAKNQKEICYEVDPVEEQPEAKMEASAPISDPLPTQQVNSPSKTVPSNVSYKPISSPDAPVLASDVIRVLTAQKLKRPFEDISLRESIRDLVKGENFRFLRSRLRKE